MFVGIVLIFVSSLDYVFGEAYKCKNEYKPSDYIEEFRVPTNCKVESLDCPHSWKSGIPEGSETASPLVYKKFLTCHEGFTLCGYVPLNPNTGEVLGSSGVTIGSGVDLGSKSNASFQSLPTALVQKLEPYFGLKKDEAACAAIEHPLNLTLEEAEQVTSVVQDEQINKTSARYDKDKDNDKFSFASLPRGIRTAIVSVWYQFGYPSAYPSFWSYVKKNDWNGAIHELRNFYKNPKDQQTGDIRRRNNEADIIQATLAKCNRSVDVVFLIDESGSVSQQSFTQGLDFVKNVVKAFPNAKLKGSDSTRFGLSTFASSYTSHFYLSTCESQSGYIAAIGRVRKRGGGTSLGAALNQILLDQFTQGKGLRPDVDGVPRILIVLTDGKAGDSVSKPAKSVRDANIVIYAIGIGGYDLNQLEDIASSETHVYKLSSYFKLEKFIATITSSTCYEPRPVPLKKQVKTTVEKNTYKYFRYSVTMGLNLQIKISDRRGLTFAYASRSNPQPYKYDHDIAFDLSKQREKVIVISSVQKKADKKVKRSTEEEMTANIYVSITSESEEAEFAIEGNECDPVNCTEGTNEILPTSTPTTTLFSTTMFSSPTPTTTLFSTTMYSSPTSRSSCAFTTATTFVVAIVAGILVFHLETFK